MAAVATLVFAGNNHLRYLITGDEAGGVATIANDAGASPDLQTDTLPGPLKQIALARVNGIGTIVPGALTQAQARALLLADDTGGSVGNAKVPRAICMGTARAIATDAILVDANVDGGGDPVITCAVAADGIAYLDVMLVGGVGIAQ